MIALAALFCVAGFERAPSTPFDRVFPIELAASDSVLAGHGPSTAIEFVAQFAGTLHIWTSGGGAADLWLRVEDEAGAVLAEDDDSGGGHTPYLNVEVESGRRLEIRAALARGDGPAKFELHFLAALETEATRTAARRAQESLVTIRSLREKREFTAAREQAERAVKDLLATPDSRSSDAVARSAATLGFEASAISASTSAREACEFACAHYARVLPGEHPGLQGVLANLADTIRGMGDFAGARALEETVLEVRARTLPADHPDLQKARQNLASTIRLLGDLNGARALFQEVFDVDSRTLPDEHPDLQAARTNLAITMGELGDIKGARALLEKVLEIDSRTLPDDHPHLQAVRSSLATTRYQLGDLAGARALYEKVLAVCTATLPDDHPHLQLTRQNLALTIRQLGDLDGALALQKRALEVVSRTRPDDHPDVQWARLNISGTIRMLGDLAGARDLEEKVLAIYSRTLPDDHPDLQMARQYLAETLQALGDHAAARVLHERVLEGLSRTLPDDHPDLQRARMSLAVTLATLGELDSARVLFENVLDVYTRTLPDDHPNLQMARANLAATKHALHDFVGARSLLEKALEVDSRTLADEHPNVQWVRQDLAATLAQLGDFAGARSLLEKALAIDERTLPDDHSELESARQNLALDIGLAVAAHESPLVGERSAFNDLLIAHARGLCAAAAAAIRDGSGREAEERVDANREQLDSALSFADGLGVFAKEPAWDEAAFRASESMRGVALTSARLARAARGHADYAALRERARKASDELASIARMGAKADDLARSRRELEAADRELVRRALELGDGAPGVIELNLAVLSDRTDSGEALIAYRRYTQTALEPGDPPLEHHVDNLSCFVLRGRGDPSSTPQASRGAIQLSRVGLGPIAAIEDAVRAWRRALGVTSDGRGVSATMRAEATADLRESGTALRKAVLDPLLPALGGARRIVVVLDDVLHLVPFDALPVDETSLAGDRWRIETRATLSELLETPEPLAEPRGLVAIGDVEYGADPDAEIAVADVARPSQRASVLRGGAWSDGFNALAGTGVEVQGIAECLHDAFGDGATSELCEHTAATRERLLALAPGARWLHVATHGWFAPESIQSWEDPEPLDAWSGLGRHLSREEQVRGMNPMLLCGLALAGANLPTDALGRARGLITAEELSTLDLSNCELVVLSACDTNVGERRAGQGVASLQKALQMAGARSVITSLWKVPDEATKELMLDFYRRLWVEKKPKHQALWEAKTKLREAKDERGEPKYTTRDWAAWVLTGAPR